MQLPWNLSFFLRYRRFMSAWSVLRYRTCFLDAARGAIPAQKEVDLKIVHPFRANVRLRPGTSDLRSLREVVIEEVYKTSVSATVDDGWVIDLGANIGLATLVFAANLPHVRIVSVEPTPGTHALLTRNTIPLVQASRVEVVQAAVWKEDGTVSLETPHDPTMFDAFTVSEGQTGSFQVRGVKLSTLLAERNIERVSLLKVDIEGAEIALLETIEEWIDRVETIVIEFHGDSRAESQFDQKMEHHGFTVDQSNWHSVIARRNGGQRAAEEVSTATPAQKAPL